MEIFTPKKSLPLKKVKILKGKDPASKPNFKLNSNSKFPIRILLHKDLFKQMSFDALSFQTSLWR